MNMIFKLVDKSSQELLFEACELPSGTSGYEEEIQRPDLLTDLA